MNTEVCFCDYFICEEKGWSGERKQMDRDSDMFVHIQEPIAVCTLRIREEISRLLFDDQRSLPLKP